MNAPEMVENLTFSEIKIGDIASHSRTLTKENIHLAALLSGHGENFPSDDKSASAFNHRDGSYGLWREALVSCVFATELPGPGTQLISQSFKFHGAVRLGDTVTATVTVRDKIEETLSVLFECECVNQSGEVLLTGEAEVRALEEKIRRPVSVLPDVRIQDHDGFKQIMAQASARPPVTTAIVHPCSKAALLAAIQAADAGLISPILVGPRIKILAAASEAGIDISAFPIVPAEHSHAAAEKAVELVKSGEAHLLMKGSLHTDELMGAVVAKCGLRTERRISHAYLMDVPQYATPLIITDAAINIAPDLHVKGDIIRNAIDLAHVIGIEVPKVAILAAVETVNADMQSTLDAAALCKMADRGQIIGGVLDGPLAFDNAVSIVAARQKGIVSPVAGQAEILIVPNLEAGNMVAKQLTFLGGADAAGVVLGARVPIILTSRADSLRTRLASCAVAVLLAQADTKAAPGLPEATSL